MSKWSRKPLGSLVRFVGGGTPDRENPAYWNGSIPWASVKDLGQPQLESTIEAITPEGLKYSASNLLPAGTVVIASRVGLGKVAVTAREIAINQDLKGLIPLSDETKPRYLFYYFAAIADQIIRAGVGATVLGVTVEYLSGLTVPLPPLAEQERIVRLLDEAAALRRLRTQADERTAAVLASTFDAEFGDPLENPRGWPMRGLNEVCSLKQWPTISAVTIQLSSNLA